MGMLDVDRGERVFRVARSADPPLPPLVVTIEESSDGESWVEAGSDTAPGSGGAA